MNADAPSLRMILTLTGIAMGSGLLVMGAADLSAPYIAENLRVAREQAASKVLPGAEHFRPMSLDSEGHLSDRQLPGATALLAGYDAHGTLIGFALQSSAQGYAGMVEILYGYQPACQCVRGFDVLRMTETPGLGDKVLSDPEFLANFQALDARLNAEGTELAQPIRTVKHGSKQHDWEIDAISGATISSKAIGKAIDQSARQTLPPLLQALKKQGDI